MFIKKYQDGGAAPDQQAANEMNSQQQGNPQQGNPQEQIMTIAQDIIQQMGPEAAAMLAQTILEMLQGADQQQQQQPTFQRRGGTLRRKN